MPRTARIVLPAVPHHITQRGNNRQDVFFVDDDRLAYLKVLQRQSARYGLKIVGYCLMTNHVHLIVVPEHADSLAKAIGRTHWLYAQYVNKLHGRSGHLWQNRFYSNGMDDSHCLLAMRYVERNPLRAGICRIAARYRWSSAAAHCGEKDGIGLLDDKLWKDLSAGLDWEQQLSLSLAREDVSRLRRSWHTGRPLASDGFLSKFEHKLGRRLRPLPIGRPRKKTPRRNAAKEK
jgi:putative transposase